ncbi:hypothetical protein B0T16DRAFT_417343 [Cercophora newfieldiana]|uniref:ATPase AAA-type core domain-containing protein n=1 Tax=Cercophora newfieldiana TaxID=92897 RepID=A0AA39Y489_9PEZI|nr:hypothetical protein B0T16DRAFT_417343 [Cercophora newfieldiana]
MTPGGKWERERRLIRQPRRTTDTRSSGSESTSTSIGDIRERVRLYQRSVTERESSTHQTRPKTPPLLSLTGTGDDWFARRKRFRQEHIDVGANHGSVSSTERIPAAEPPKSANQLDSAGTGSEGEADIGVHFLKHITISRDQTKEQQHREERLALQAVLAKAKAFDHKIREFHDESEPLSDPEAETDSDSTYISTIDESLRARLVGIGRSAEPIGAFSPPDPTARSSSIELSATVTRPLYTATVQDWRQLTYPGSPKHDHKFPSMAYVPGRRPAEHEVAGVDEWDESDSEPDIRARAPVRVIHRRRRRVAVAQRASDSEGNSMPPGTGVPMEKDEIRRRIAQLNTELETLKSQLNDDSGTGPATTSTNARPTPWRTIYRIKRKAYLGKPEWQHGTKGLRLGASMPIPDVNNFLDRHDEILFLVFKDYNQDAPSVSNAEARDEWDVPPTPHPSVESIWIAKKSMGSAMMCLSETYSDFASVFPGLGFEHEFSSPYLPLFHMFPSWKDHSSRLSSKDKELVTVLFEYVEETMSATYRDVIQQLASGRIFPSSLGYLVKPGDIIVRPKPQLVAYMATDWLKNLGTYQHRKGRNEALKNLTDPRRNRTRQASNRVRKAYMYSDEEESSDSGREISGDEDDDAHVVWTVTGWNWVMNKGGSLARNNDTLGLKVNLHSAEPLDITSFEWYPLRYASDEIRNLLQKRGHTFWRCRERQFVGYAYQPDETDDLESANERFVIDFTTYRKLHPETKKSLRSEHSHDGQQGDSQLEKDFMQREAPPTDETINLSPSVLVGFNLRLKKWVDIEVDRIKDVDWNKKAFENLVVAEDTKHLVQALISNQVKAEKATDLISGKGNGLIILLHGVAELAEKPLYRVTCGDIGTKPEEVEKYLETVLLLGKIWGCVVLLDEADVFLEERSLTDLKRNALVSVFLRVLEYYDGILILTSNRVGTFDQAFKSRIQLALHYDNLKKPQRRKIWRNFFTRLRDLGESETQVDYDDLDDHLDDLAEEEMNGRQIRNAITTARQLAQFDGKRFSYAQLQHVIGIAGRFEGYLKNVRRGYSDDQLARDDGLR